MFGLTLALAAIRVPQVEPGVGVMRGPRLATTGASCEGCTPTHYHVRYLHTREVLHIRGGERFAVDAGDVGVADVFVPDEVRVDGGFVDG